MLYIVKGGQLYPIPPLVDFCTNLWCNIYKAAFFLCAIFFDLFVFFVFTINARFLCELCGRVTPVLFSLPNYTMQNPL